MSNIVTGMQSTNNHFEQKCWVLTDGKAGTESQCVGLAAALGWAPNRLRVRLRAPWRWLSPWVRLGVLGSGLAADDPPLTPPWPQVLIAAGRRAAGPALAIKSCAGADCTAIFLQTPLAGGLRFDAVVAPAHDHPRAALNRNLIITKAPLHRLTAAAITDAANTWDDKQRWTTGERKRVAVLIGGRSKAYPFGPNDIQAIAATVRGLVSTGWVPLLTLSRRTPSAALAPLRAAAGDNGLVWDGTGPNPYPAILGVADAIIVTADSASMTADAISTGTPVYVHPLQGGTVKFQHFHKQLVADGHTRPCTVPLTPYTPVRLDESQVVAQALIGRLPRCAGPHRPPV